jgi:hypothetical protein
MQTTLHLYKKKLNGPAFALALGTGLLSQDSLAPF